MSIWQICQSWGTNKTRPQHRKWKFIMKVINEIFLIFFDQTFVQTWKKLFCSKISMFRPKFRASIKLSSFDQNFVQTWKNLFCSKISMFRPNFRVSTKLSSFDQTFEFRPNFRVSIKLLSFGQNVDIFLILTKIWNWTKNFENYYYYTIVFRLRD